MVSCRPDGGSVRSLLFVLRDYEYLSPLASGDVAVDGIDLVLSRDASALDRVLTDTSVHGGELSLSRHIKRVADGDHSFVGIPFFTTGTFRQRGFFVRRDSGLRTLGDLAHKRIGTNEWPATANTWARAALREAGVRVDEIHWWIGSVDGTAGKVTQEQDRLPGYVQRAPADRTLGDMLLVGDLDALMCPRPPKGFYDANSTVVRLLPDYKKEEADYFSRTKIRPIAHMVGVRRHVYDEQPGVIAILYRALEDSKRMWQARLWRLADALPWLLPALEETRAAFGQDWAPNGVEPNRNILQTLLDEALAQGLIANEVRVEALFPEFQKVAGP
jgi:4,5-dihydroxyphthalate decarboxylase